MTNKEQSLLERVHELNKENAELRKLLGFVKDQLQGKDDVLRTIAAHIHRAGI